MAVTLAGARLTAEHRSAQLALRAVTRRQVLQVWPAFDAEHAAKSWPPVEKALLAIIGQRRVTGYVMAERFTALKHPDPARTALGRVSGAVTRHVLDAGGTRSSRLYAPTPCARLGARHVGRSVLVLRDARFARAGLWRA